ncbi:MAG: heparinase II/III family protein [Flavobacteriaceae bacterium]
MAFGDRTVLAGLALRQAFRGLHLAFHTGPLYRWRYSGRVPQRLLVAPQDIRTADPVVASEIYAGIYALDGSTVETDGASPFQIAAPNDAWHVALHGFGWLRHLRAADPGRARDQARALVDEWIGLCGRYEPRSWGPHIVSRRIISWLSHAPLLLNDCSPDFHRRFMRSLSRQTRYLARTSPDATDGAARLTAAIALTLTGLCMAGRERSLRRHAQWLAEEIDKQILPDGGHVSRNPQAIVELLLDLLPLGQTFTARDMPPPSALVRAIDRMMPMLRFFRLGDGGLTRFNGASSSAPDLIATLLAYDENRGKPVPNARFSGYLRMEAGDTVLVADTGATPPVHVSARAHAGALSFEMSHRRQPIIVNCGAPASASAAPQWREACRATAAHSTAVVNNTSSARMIGQGRIRDWIGPLVLSGPARREGKIDTNETMTIASMEHDGYRSAFGIIHHRRLALLRDGSMLQGEDLFTGPNNRQLAINAAGRYAIRFHLHPAISATLDEENGRVLLFSRTDSAFSWIFSADGAEIGVEESVFLTALAGPRRTEQIVLTGRCGRHNRVTWSLASNRASQSG